MDVQGFSEHQHQRRRTPPHLVRPFGGPANPRLTSWTFPTNLPPGPSETIMNVAPLVRRPLGCLKATLRQTRHQRLLVRQMATEASQTASEQRPPELNFCKPSLSLYPRLLSGEETNPPLPFTQTPSPTASATPSAPPSPSTREAPPRGRRSSRRRPTSSTPYTRRRSRSSTPTACARPCSRAPPPRPSSRATCS